MSRIVLVVGKTQWKKLNLQKMSSPARKKSCVSTGVKKPGNTYASPTAMI